MGLLYIKNQQIYNAFSYKIQRNVTLSCPTKMNRVGVTLTLNIT